MASPKRSVVPVLSALARGVLGSSYVTEVPERILEQISHLPGAAERKQLLGLLRILDTKVGALAFTGKPTPVSWLSATEAETLMKKLRMSRLPDKRRFFLAILSLAQSALYSHTGPEWERIGYQGPMGPPPEEPRRLEPVPIERDEVLQCDFAIVGSGAGGGVTAAVLAAEGYDVIVLEKGDYRSESDFSHLEAESTLGMYLYGARLTTTDLGVQILAGSTLGGGTVVNYTTSFKTPELVLKQWAEISGVEAFVSGEIEESLDICAARLGVNTDSSAAGKRDELMEEGLKRLGWHVDALPRAVRGCTQDEQCGFCGFGCRPGAKQSSMRTWLEDAASQGARVVVGADVRRVRIADNKARGIEAVAGGHRLVVETNKGVIAAAGSIETPALLLRSGLGGQVGHNLRLHPGTAAFGVFDDDVRMWEGTTQARYSAEFRNWDDGYGPIFETVPVHPGGGSSVVPWTSAKLFREAMGGYAKLGFCAVLPRDKTGGRVKIGKDGQPIVEYRIRDDDSRRIVEGLVNAGKVMEAAGAREIYSIHRDPIRYTPNGPPAHDRWAEEVRARGFSARVATGVSYHQMGSCRMGVDPATAAIGPDNETHEVNDLFVVDASTFPTASGVNPMLSIYGIAHRAARRIATRYS